MRKYLFFFIVVVNLSCNKQNEWLDIKPNKSDVVPKTINEFQQLLDAESTMNSNCIGLGIYGSDNFFVKTTEWQAQPVFDREAYIWQKNFSNTEELVDWTLSYGKVFVTNVVIDGLKNLQVSLADSSAFNNVKGSAHFLRAFYFFDLAQVFCLPYSSENLDKPGIVLRTDPDVSSVSTRSTVRLTYEKIIEDLLEAEKRLPVTPQNKRRPSKAAAQLLLSRVYLAMGNFVQSNTFASAAIASSATLIDYNTLSLTASFGFPNDPKNNPEIVFFATSAARGIYRAQLAPCYVDTLLYSSYKTNDLRIPVFYKTQPGRILLRGSYSGNNLIYNGLSINEAYFNKAESLVRMNNTTDALNTLNSILLKRFKRNTYVPETQTNQNQLLNIVLEERRKELPFTGQLRWMDLRRLNLNPTTAITIYRNINNTIFSLAPNDPRYVYPIPQSEVRIFGLEQNQR